MFACLRKVCRPRSRISLAALCACGLFAFSAIAFAEERPVALASPPAATAGAHATRIEVDEKADAIRIIVGGEQRAVFTDGGLSVTGDIDYTGSITDISDLRLKTDIQPLPAQAANIGALKPVAFGMADDPAGRTEYGLIAQQVEPIYPALVQARPDGAKAVNYAGLIAPLIAALQELQADNARLRNRVEALEARTGRTPTEAEAP